MPLHIQYKGENGLFYTEKEHKEMVKLIDRFEYLVLKFNQEKEEIKKGHFYD